jgi:periplasmic mercuric ion binding protein
MKQFIIAIVALFIGFAANAQVKKETVKVYGNCGMCKKRIEKAARGAGATTASWSDETQMLTIQYNAGKISNKKIQEAVAAVGHDTKDCTATDAAYNKLHECCMYERKPKG